MTAYITSAELRLYLPQLKDDSDTNLVLERCIDEAQAVVDAELEFSFDGYATEAAAKIIRNKTESYQVAIRSGELYGLQASDYFSNLKPSVYLTVPYYQPGTLTAVTLDGTAVPDYQIEDDDHRRLWRPYGWRPGNYTVTAKWGYGPAPASVVRVVVELAVNFWRGRDRAMYTDVVGVEGGGAVGYTRALTNLQRYILYRVKNKYAGPGVA